MVHIKVSTADTRVNVWLISLLQPSRPAENLEPLNFGPDLEPIKEEMTPRESLDVSAAVCSARREVMNHRLNVTACHCLLHSSDALFFLSYFLFHFSTKTCTHFSSSVKTSAIKFIQFVEWSQFVVDYFLQCIHRQQTSQHIHTPVPMSSSYARHLTYVRK